MERQRREGEEREEVDTCKNSCGRPWYRVRVQVSGWSIQLRIMGLGNSVLQQYKQPLLKSRL